MHFLIGFFAIFFSVGSAFAEDKLTATIASIDADVVFMRHALAPGFGDPANFALENCATQRNLDSVGRPWKLVRKYDVAQQLSPKSYQASGADAKRRLNCWDLDHGIHFLG